MTHPSREELLAADPADLWERYLAEADNPSPQGAFAFAVALFQDSSSAKEPPSPDDAWEGAAEDLRLSVIEQCSKETADLVSKGHALVNQLSAVIDRLGQGLAYSSTLAAMNAFKGALASPVSSTHSNGAEKTDGSQS